MSPAKTLTGNRFSHPATFSALPSRNTTASGFLQEQQAHDPTRRAHLEMADFSDPQHRECHRHLGVEGALPRTATLSDTDIGANHCSSSVLGVPSASDPSPRSELEQPQVKASF